MRPILPVLALTVVRLCLGQARPDMVQTGPDLRDVYARAAGSVFVVKGHVEDVKSVQLLGERRLVDEPGHIVVLSSTDDYARLVTVVVDQVLCRRSDFVPATSQPTAPVHTVKMLIPAGEPSWKCEFGSAPGCVSEHLHRGSEYLLFLREDPRSATLSSVYQVEPGDTYYRAVLGYRGAIELPANPNTSAAPLLAAVTALCDAVQPPDVPSKLARLRALSVTADPRWRGEVDRTIRALEAAQSKPNQ
jgi:hypothetical protein